MSVGGGVVRRKSKWWHERQKIYSGNKVEIIVFVKYKLNLIFLSRLEYIKPHLTYTILRLLSTET